MANRPGLPALLRVAAAVCALLAAWGPPSGGASSARLRIVAWDASASVGARAPSRADVARFTDDLRASDRAAVIVFGEDARVAAPLSSSREVAAALRAAPVSPHGSSVAAALRAAAAIRAEAGADVDAELVLASDGRATDTSEQLLSAAAALRASGGAALRIGRRAGVAEPSVATELRGPGRVRRGEPFALEARGTAPEAGAILSLSRSGHVVETRRVSGAFRVAFARIEDATGLAVYQASAGGDVPAAEARVLVAESGAMLVVTRDDAIVPTQLAAAGRATRMRIAADAARIGPSLAAHDLVVVCDATADACDAGGLVSALASYVRAGGGVLLVGGEHAFGAGGWAGRAIEDLSPLRARPPDDAGVAVLFAIDASGSMGETWPGAGMRRDAAVGAAASAFARRAGTDVRIAVRRFSDRVLGSDVSLAFHGGDADQRRALAAELERAPAATGSTALLPVLDDALAQLSSRSERSRSVVIFSDGASAEPAETLLPAMERLVRAGIRVTVVVPGAPESGAPLLVAARKCGAAVVAADRPELLDVALRRVEREMRGDDPFAGATTVRPAPSAEHAFREGAADVPLVRRNRAWLATDASALLVAADGQVVAAQRTLGAGRVVAVAADLAWLPGALAADLARIAARPASGDVRIERGPGATLLARIRGGGSSPATCVFERDGREVGRVPVRAAGDGLIAADLPAAGEPSLVRFVDGAGVEISAAGLDLPAPMEYRDPPATDIDALGAAAAPAVPPRGAPLRPWLAALAVLLLVIAAAVKSRAVRAR